MWQRKEGKYHSDYKEKAMKKHEMNQRKISVKAISLYEAI